MYSKKKKLELLIYIQNFKTTLLSYEYLLYLLELRLFWPDFIIIKLRYINHPKYKSQKVIDSENNLDLIKN